LKNNQTPLVSIIILNYNAGKLLLNCVESILKSDFKNYEIIVVDNNSKDKSHLLCKERFEKIELIENSKNFGFCEGNNIGVRNARGEFIIIINPDTTVTPNWIDKFLNAQKENGDGIYQPKIISLEDKKTILSTGNMIHLFGFGFARDKGNLKTKHIENIEKITYSSGTCIFTTKKLFEKIGMFDSFLFLYHDDLDLSWRASMQKIDSFYVPTITVFHKESYNFQWSSKKFYWLERNRKYCILTHYSKETQKKIASELFLSDVLVWISYFFKGFLLVKIRAELEIRKNKKKIEEKYMELEKNKLVSDQEMIKKFSDEIWIPKDISNNFFNKLFNLTLKKLSNSARKKLK
jgi:GT2 family glycosyltransferase